LIVCIIGAICFWAIDRFVNEARLSNLLKLFVILICLAAILQRGATAGGNYLAVTPLTTIRGVNEVE
jgi:hypothetical protein